ncbi:MAG: DUF2236 domain-containing protein [Phaeodactylibacter sp.]|nr:DUF2236 domain-containing protein [Phaeodactylibacter sp.]
MANRDLWTNEFLRAQRQVADPLADETIRRLVEAEGPESARQLFDVLIRNIGLPLQQMPKSFLPFLEATRALPDSLDEQQLWLGSQFFLDHGPKLLVFLFYRSLPLLYAHAHGAQVLVQTGRLAHDGKDMQVFARRIAETGQFLMDVMIPGNLKPGAMGIQSIQKVRLIHASIRHFIPEAHWDTAQLGLPINQQDMASTLMTFSVAITDALEQFGIQESNERLAAYFNTWNAIGGLMGVNKGLIPDNLEEGRWLLEKNLELEGAPSEAGSLLTKALLDFSVEQLPNSVAKTPTALIQYLVGPEHSAQLGLLPVKGCLVRFIPGIIGSLFRVGERLEDLAGPSLVVWLDRFSRTLLGSMIGYFDEYKQRAFRIPMQLQARWLPQDLN